MAAEIFQAKLPVGVPSDPESHLRFLFGSDFVGCLEVSRIGRDKKVRTRSFAASELDEAVTYIVETPPEENIYFAYGLQGAPVSQMQRGKAATVVAIPCLWFDLDHLNPSNPEAHREQNLPSSQGEALAFLEHLPLPPTMIINSGNGLYPIWAFERPWSLPGEQERERASRLSKAVQRRILELGRNRGWHFDTTSDLNRLTRPIGSFNRKGEPLPVELIRFTGRRYRPEELEAAFPPSPEKNKSPAANDNSRSDEGHADPNLVVGRCAWCRHCRDDAATLSEPEWKALCTVIARCIDGRASIHQLSRPYPDYDPVETDRKVDQSLTSGGPIRCDTIEDSFGGYCGSCEFHGRISSPIVLGYPVFDLFKDWVYVAEEDSFHNLRFPQVVARTVFTEINRHLVKKGQTPHVIFNSSRATTKVDRTEFDPEKPKFFQSGGARIMNVWTPPKVVPADGDPSVFLDHLAYLVPDDDERRALMNTLAFIIQYPGRRLGYMTLIKGVGGTGKSYLGQTLMKILGKDPVRFIRTEDLSGRWTDWIAEKALVIAEELLAGGRLEIANRLKAMITEPLVVAEAKFQRPRQVRNTAKFLAFTNYDVSTYVTPDDRRTFYIASPAVVREQAYYTRLWGWTDENLGVIYKTLLDHDLSQFEPMAHAPMTDAKRQLIEDSRPPIDAELMEMIEQGIPPFHRDIVRSEEVRDALCLRGGDFVRASTRKVGQSLRNLGAIRLEQIKVADGTRPRLWVVRNREQWTVNQTGKWEVRDLKAVYAELLKAAHIRQW